MFCEFEKHLIEHKTLSTIVQIQQAVLEAAERKGSPQSLNQKETNNTHIK